MSVRSFSIYLIIFALISLALGANGFTRVSHAQNISAREFTPDTERAVYAQGSFSANRARPNAPARVRTESLSERTVNPYEARNVVRPPARELLAVFKAPIVVLGFFCEH